ncbi:helix-turn-helix domain-containing protein [Klenkia sp. PcliD-1-E]|uniref:winged helix-turn-helix transcriptional regulator n=1 Tax=Klenkia sp. PcliD-1-E TaxID=2954492 RepID=UPI002098348E|nr:helix-turn-helix domain-containing protein [Klenkia sp. PcliD-1-E]MCO7221019.1 helix-turn-helix transcriptional regulator [Klenkia sp. PcliD-1-E]
MDAPTGVREHCPVAATLDLVGSRSSLLLMREAALGTRRFADFAVRTGLSEPMTARRLAELVDAGLLARADYREPGQRVRQEYRLTSSGVDFLPVITALRQWGDAHADVPGGRPLRVDHAGCGAEVVAEVRCTAGHAVPPAEAVVTRLR